MKGPDSDDDSDAYDPTAPETYRLIGRDQVVVATAIQLMQKILHAPFTRPAEVVSLAKLLHVFRRVPRVSTDMFVSVGLSGPTRRFGEHEIYHYWDVRMDGTVIEVSSGGSFYRPSTGGD